MLLIEVDSPAWSGRFTNREPTSLRSLLGMEIHGKETVWFLGAEGDTLWDGRDGEARWNVMKRD